MTEYEARRTADQDAGRPTTGRPVVSDRLDRFNPADAAGYGRCRATGHHVFATRHALAQCPAVTADDLPSDGHTPGCLRAAQTLLEEHLEILPSGDIVALIPDYFPAVSDLSGDRRRAQQLRALTLRHLSAGDAMCTCAQDPEPAPDRCWEVTVHGMGNPIPTTATGPTLVDAVRALLAMHPQAHVEVSDAIEGTRRVPIMPHRWFGLIVAELDENGRPVL